MFSTLFMSSGVKMCSEELQQGLAADFLDDDAGDHVIRVAVLPLSAGIEIERLASPGSRICCAVVGWSIMGMT